MDTINTKDAVIEVAMLSGVSRETAKMMLKAARKVMPYPQSCGASGESFGADQAVIAALRAKDQPS